MSFVSLAATALGFSLAAMFLLWLFSLRLRDASIVDIWWGPGFAAAALLTYALAEHGNPLVTALTALWGLRLGGYLYWRNAGHGEDPRYVAMRRHYGERFSRVSLFTVFGLQALLQWFVALPVFVAQATTDSAAFTALSAVGTGLFALGLAFESVGDWQLARFRSDTSNAGQVMDRGLWRYTRHPNYFGDFCVWWGIFLVCLDTPGASYTLASPLLMSFLLLRVSGVPLLEKSMAKRRPGYVDYQRRTSAFFPRPPRS
jgi:steroid 5-alpha reductase family enzyme